MALIRNDRDKVLQASGIRVEQSVALILSKYTVVLPADASGVVAQPSNANTSVSVLVDGIEDSSNWTISATGVGCLVNVSGQVVTFTDFSVSNTTDTCSYTVTVSKFGFDDKTATVSVVRARSGAAAFSLVLDKEIITLEQGSTEVVPNFDGNYVLAKVMSGAQNVSDQWVISKTDTNVTSYIEPQEISQNTVLYITFDSGTVPLDLSSYNHTLLKSNGSFFSTSSKKIGLRSLANEEVDNPFWYYLVETADTLPGYGTQDVQGELWFMFRANTVNAHNKVIVSTNNGLIDIRYSASSSTISFSFSGHGVSSITPVVLPRSLTDAWYHIAWSVKSSRIYFFLNGTIVNSGGHAVLSTSTASYTLALGGGGSTGGTYTSVQGCIDNVRLIVGYAQWTESFIPTEVPYIVHNDSTAIVLNGYDKTKYNPDYKNVRLQMHFDTDLNDSSKNKVVPKHLNTTKAFISSTQSAVGSTGSLRVINDNTPGGGLAVSYENVPDLLMLGSYSIKARVRLNSYPDSYSASFFEVYGQPCFSITGTLETLGGVSAPGGLGCLIMGTPMASGGTQYAKKLELNTWYLLETTRRKDGTRRLYVDNVLIATYNTNTEIPNNVSTSTGAPYYNNSSVFSIDDNGNPSRIDKLDIYWGSSINKTAVDCWLDEISISTGAEYLEPYAFSDSMYPDSDTTTGYIDIQATRLGDNPIVLTKRVPVVTNYAKKATLISSLSTSVLPIKARFDGVPTTYTEANTRMSILLDGIEDSNNWQGTTSIGGVSSLTTGNTVKTLVTVTDVSLEQNINWGAIAAYRHGFPTQYHQFQIIKNKDAALPVATLSNPLIYINCDYLGNPLSGAFTTAVGTVEVKINGVVNPSYSPQSTSAISNVTVSYQYDTVLGKNTYAITSMSADTGFVDINIVHSEGTYPTAVSRVNVAKIKANKPPITSSLSTSVIQIQGDTEGNVPSSSYVQNTVTAKIFFGDVDDTSNWTFTYSTGSSSFTVSQTSNSFTVTNLPAVFSTGTLTITASKSGESNIVFNCVVTKTKTLAPEGLAQNTYLGSSYEYGVSSAAASATFKSDGRVLFSYIGATSTKNWYNPSTAGVGDSYFLTVTGPSIGTMGGITRGTPYLLSSDRSINTTLSSEGYIEGMYSYTIRANSGGSPGAVLARGSFDMAVQAVTGS